MTEAQKILSLIESVSPDDTVALDEIDKYVHLFLTGEWPAHNDHITRTVRVEIDSVSVPLTYEEAPQYTRSRDALKAIRPDDFKFRLFQDINLNWQACLYKSGSAFFGGMKLWFPTEELAELYAIVQAIEYQRGKENGAV